MCRQPLAGRLQPAVTDELGLTPREREVLALVADGRTDRQIAEALLISDKTASVHVSNILAKLGVADRGEAAAVAHRLRLAERLLHLPQRRPAAPPSRRVIGAAGATAMPGSAPWSGRPRP